LLYHYEMSKKIIKDVPTNELIGTKIHSLKDHDRIGVVEKLEIRRGMIMVWVRWNREAGDLYSCFFHHEGKNEVCSLDSE
jgi:hypothetical protein